LRTLAHFFLFRKRQLIFSVLKACANPVTQNHPGVTQFLLTPSEFRSGTILERAYFFTSTGFQLPSFYTEPTQRWGHRNLAVPSVQGRTPHSPTAHRQSNPSNRSVNQLGQWIPPSPHISRAHQAKSPDISLFESRPTRSALHPKKSTAACTRIFAPIPSPVGLRSNRLDPEANESRSST